MTARPNEPQASEPEWIAHDGSDACPVEAGHDVEIQWGDGEASRDNFPQGWAWGWDQLSAPFGKRLIVSYRDWTAFAQASEAVGDVPNPPAFPSHAGDPEMSDPRNQISCGGMTLRDWFAGQALGAMQLSTGGARSDGVLTTGACKSAYAYADAMLRARLPAAAVAAVERDGA